jgi:hypothetical protein
MAVLELQVQLFQQIRAKLPEHISLAEEIAGLLKVSTDSAYRRIRGEKPLDFEEIHLLCSHFKLSLDNLMNLQPGAFQFSGTFVKPSEFSFDQYLQGVLQQMKYMNGFREKKIYYLCKDIPIFHHFHIREIAAFKHYFWMKTILQAPEFMNRPFSFDDYPDELFQLGRKALEQYQQMPATEIWNIETIVSSINQVEFYKDSDVFRNDKDIARLYDALEALTNHLEKQAEAGYQFSVDDPGNKKAAYGMYFNEVILGDNSILAALDGSRVAFLIHSVINIISTRDIGFTTNMEEHIRNLLRKSTLISAVSERERSIFFNRIRRRMREGERS